MTKILVIGCGSIGRRHMRVFRELGVDFIGAADPRQDRLDQAAAEIGPDALALDHKAALAGGGYDMAVIAAPTHLHTPLAMDAARAGCHLFIEKPVAMDEAGLADLAVLCAGKSLITYTAYCYRFIPSVERLRAILGEGVIGKPLAARLHTSSYLPDWHPWEDYRDFYMARKDQGGGALLDESHGIDLLRWLFGEVAEVGAMVCNVSDLEISSDDLSMLQLRFESGLAAQAHFDLLGRTPRIGLEVIGAEGTLLWDRIDPSIRVFSAATGEWTEESFDKDDTVQSYPRQAKAFLECLKGGQATRNDLAEGRRTLAVLRAAFDSSQSGMVKQIPAIP